MGKAHASVGAAGMSQVNRPKRQESRNDIIKPHGTGCWQTGQHEEV